MVGNYVQLRKNKNSIVEAIRLETRMPDNPFFAEYVIGIYNFLEIESSLLVSIQDLNFRLGIQVKDWSVENKLMFNFFLSLLSCAK